MFPLAMLFGAFVGLSLGLTGGGGAIFAVPLLVYGLSVDPREAIGVSLVTVGATALVGFVQRYRLGLVEPRTGLLFAVAGMATAPLGARIAARIPESWLLVLLAAVMLVIAARMWSTASIAAERHLLHLDASATGPVCRRDPQGVLHWNSRCALLLAGIGLASGLLTGLFGVGGGFIIVPALVLFSGMDIQRAVGTSLLVITLVSASGVSSIVATGRTMPWPIVAWFTGGSILGLLVGSRLAVRLRGPALQRGFAIAILLVAGFMILRNLNI